MDQGLKERLIGAAILVALGVWLIPWVLDGGGEHETAPTTLELPVPEQAAPMRTHTIHLDADRSTPVPAAADAAAASSATPRPAPTAEPQAATAASEPERSRTAAEPQVSPAAAEAQASAPAAEAQVGAAARPRSSPASAEAASTGGAAGAEDRGRTAAPTEDRGTTAASTEDRGRTAAPTGAAAEGDWTVQLGSFGEEANARRLVERVATYGYKAEISSVRSGGRTLYRVRVGPHATRAQAQAAASALAAHGVTAQVLPVD